MVLKKRIQVRPKNLSRPGPPGLQASYSHGLLWGDLLFISGQVAYDSYGKVIKGGVEAQTRQILENMSQICKEGGTSIDHMLKVTVYMTDITDFARMDKVYRQYFSVPPTRATVEVSSLVKTHGAEGLLVEIEGIAAVPKLRKN